MVLLRLEALDSFPHQEDLGDKGLYFLVRGLEFKAKAFLKNQISSSKVLVSTFFQCADVNLYTDNEVKISFLDFFFKPW